MLVDASQLPEVHRSTRPIRRAAIAIAVTVASTPVHFAGPPPSAVLPPPVSQSMKEPAPAREGFSEADVNVMARQLATTPFRPPPAATRNLTDLEYDQYRQIQVRYENSVWAKEKLPFQIDLLPAGFVYKSEVQVDAIENGKVIPLAGSPDRYRYGPGVPANVRGVPLSLSGFRVRAPINTRGVATEFIVFQGAS